MERDDERKLYFHDTRQKSLDVEAGFADLSPRACDEMERTPAMMVGLTHEGAACHLVGRT